MRRVERHKQRLGQVDSGPKRCQLEANLPLFTKEDGKPARSVPKQAIPEARTDNVWDVEGRDGWDAEAAYLNHLLPRGSGPSRSLDYLPFLREEGPYALYHRTERPRRTLETHPLFFLAPADKGAMQAASVPTQRYDGGSNPAVVDAALLHGAGRRWCWDSSSTRF